MITNYILYVSKDTLSRLQSQTNDSFSSASRQGYCGKEYDESYGGALENGSPACPECVADEEAEEERKRRKEVEKAKTIPQE